MRREVADSLQQTSTYMSTPFAAHQAEHELAAPACCCQMFWASAHTALFNSLAYLAHDVVCEADQLPHVLSSLPADMTHAATCQGVTLAPHQLHM